MKKFILLFAIPALAACGGGYNPDKDLARQAIELGDSSYLDLGNGRGVMTSTASTVSSGANFEIQFSIADQGRLVLYTYANNDLSAGLEFVFTRQGSTLNVFLRQQGTEQDLSSLFASVNAAETLTFNIDVHNNERPAHVLMWTGAKRTGLNHRNTIYNSGEDSLDLGYDASPGNGQGRSWGFEVANSQILNTRLSSPQDAH